ncbi:MAG: hypothetical protein A2289_07525 [Deltaproteobacteria bacterium RIFOXYA12_FULL_58_15]|nr:MAG: hypothetical protein A2289_07525 [Deltaproteobacteria bacterium RIFOXYA12_FULL_58_15]
MTRSGLLRDSRVHLTVLLTLIAAAHLAWLHVDESPPGSDEAMYAKAALRFSDAVTGKGTVSYRALFDPAGSRQPIPVWTAGIAVLLQWKLDPPITPSNLDAEHIRNALHRLNRVRETCSLRRSNDRFGMATASSAAAASAASPRAQRNLASLALPIRQVASATPRFADNRARRS